MPVTRTSNLDAFEHLHRPRTCGLIGTTVRAVGGKAACAARADRYTGTGGSWDWRYHSSRGRNMRLPPGAKKSCNVGAMGRSTLDAFVSFERSCSTSLRLLLREAGSDAEEGPAAAFKGGRLALCSLTDDDSLDMVCNV
eukprot:scaffold965_cov158-Amphora_coffeaeformis.AAC.19